MLEQPEAPQTHPGAVPGSRWLNIETWHKNIPRRDRSWPACSHKSVNSGLSVDQFDSFHSDEESSDPVEDEHHVLFDCPSYTYARQLISDTFALAIHMPGS